MWLIIFGVFATTGLLQFASVDWSRPLSIYDEVPHIDYTFRLADGQATTWGDLYSQRTLGIADCLEQESANPQCISATLRQPEDRWPQGYSYEAHQTPAGYLPFAVADVLLIDEQSDHYSQIRRLRLMNVPLWLVFAGVWTALVLQVTKRRLPATAASVVVALNPLLFDRFTYVTNDGPAIVGATAVAAWLLFIARHGPLRHWWAWLLPALALGLLMGMVKPTALIILVPLVLAIGVGARLGSGKGRKVPVQWWFSAAVIGALGAAGSVVYQAFIDARSRSDFETVLSTILPRGPLDLPTASILRIPDLTELVMGSGARTELTPYEWGMRAPSVWIVIFALAGAAAFFVSLALRNNAFPRLPALDPRILGYGVLAGFLAILIAHPALHFLRGEFLMPFTAGRFQSPMIPLAGLVLLPAFQRFRWWAVSTVLAGLIIAAFFSGSLDMALTNVRVITGIG